MPSMLDNDRIIQATAVGAETQFPYDFPIKAAADPVVKRRVGDTITTLVLNVDYSVTGVGDVGGGQIVLDVGVFPTGATAGDEYTIFGDQVVKRAAASDFAKGGDFFASTINAQLDDLTRISQDLKRDTDASVRKDPAITETLDPLIKTLVDKKGLKLVEDSPGVFSLSLTDSDIDTAAAAAAASAAAALVSENAAQSSEDDAQISEDNASTSESNAATSAAQAATSAAAGLYKNVFDIAFGDSPFTVLATQDGFLIQVDTSGGNVVVKLVDSTTLTADFRVAVAKMTADANTIDVQRQGTDTINGGTNQLITSQFETFNFILDQSQGEYLATGGAASSLSGGDGIDFTGGVVSVDLATDPGLEISAAKLRAKVGEGIERVAAGIQAKINGTTLDRSASGIKVADNAIDLAQLVHGTSLDLQGFNNTGVPIRIPKGSALEFLRINAAGNAHEYAAAGGGLKQAPKHVVVSGSTTSTTYVTATGSITLTTTGGNILAMYFGTWHHNAATNMFFALRIDTGGEVQIYNDIAVVNDPQGIPLAHLFTGVSSASHTIEIRFKSNSGTLFIDKSALVVMEVEA